MPVTESKRPGVYSQYTLTGAANGKRLPKYAAVVAKSKLAPEGGCFEVNTYAQALALFGEPDNSAMLSAVAKVLFAYRPEKIFCCPVPFETGTAADYQACFDSLRQNEQVGAILCDSGEPAVLAALKDNVMAASANRKERYGFAAGNTAKEAADIAASLNCERICVCCPPGSVVGCSGAILTAASVAGAILSMSDISQSLNGASLLGLEVIEALSEEDIELLLGSGVLTCEQSAGSISVIKGLTTRTKTAGVPDNTFGSLTVMLEIDDVMISVRNMLAVRLAGMKNTRMTRDSIKSQVTVELMNKKEAGVISDFADVVVKQSSEDNSVCLVQLQFEAAGSIDQIYITAQIQL